MKYALHLAEDGRILSATYPQYAALEDVFVDELPEGDISDYLYVDGQYVYEPLPEPVEPEPTSQYVTWEELAAAIAEGVNSI